MRFALRWLIRLFPVDFRERYAAEMLADVERDVDRARTRGLPARTWMTIATAADLVRAAAAERWKPTRLEPPTVPAQGRQDMRFFGEWAHDVRHAVRVLRRSPSFTVTAVITLALAIGATAGMFDVVNTVLIRPLPFPNPERLVYIGASAPGTDLPKEVGLGDEFIEEYQQRSRLLESVSTFNSFTSTFRVGERVERISMSMPTSSLFATLHARPMIGRLPTAEDQDHAVELSYGAWKDWFNGDSSVLGKSYYTAGAMRTIIGVMGKDFAFPDDGVQLWISYTIDPAQIRVGQFGNGAVGRMKPGVTIDQLRRELNGLAQEIPQRFGGSPHYRDYIARHRAVVRSLDTQLLGPYARPLWVLLAAAGIVLVIACVNVANLFMVRAEQRHHELAVRRAIGAGRGQLVRLQLAEAIVIAGAAAALAIVLALVMLPLFLRAAPSDVPRLENVHIDAATLLFTLGAAVLAAIACGLAPAFRASAPDLRRLREGGRGSTGRRHWGRDALVAVQTAMALVLLIGSGLLVRSFRDLRGVNPGYTTKNIFTFQIAPDRPSLKDGPSFAQFDREFMDRLRALPGVQSVGLVDNVPLDEGTDQVRFRTEEMASDSPGALGNATIAGGDYFKTMEIPVLSGRAFDQSDDISAQNHIVISKAAANLLWPHENPVGRRVRMLGGADSTEWLTVIGVVGDVMQYSFHDTPEPLIYVPLIGPHPTSWAAGSPAYVVKTPRAETIAPEVRAIVHQVAPEAPMYRVFTMAQLARRSMVQLSFTMLTLAIAASLALLLGAVGLYGVLSYVVAERTREIGVRMALGATAEQVRRMVVAQGARVLGFGVLVGVVAAILSTRALGSLLYGVKPLDVPVFVLMPLAMVAVGLLASYLPARRASSVDPMESLRSD